jgi:hypothetical protein
LLDAIFLTVLEQQYMRQVNLMETLKTNTYGLNLLTGTSADLENYLFTDNDGKSLLQFAESCYDNLLQNFAEAIA